MLVYTASLYPAAVEPCIPYLPAQLATGDAVVNITCIVALPGLVPRPRIISFNFCGKLGTLLTRAVNASRPLVACPFVKVSPGRTKPVSPEGVVCAYLSPRDVI